jgi:DUF1680 family protein
VIRVNGELIKTDVEPGHYSGVRRIWRSGDVLELDPPIPAQLIEANPLVEVACG